MADPARPRRVAGLAGTVTRAPFAPGSKSEREGIWLETVDGRFLLRRQDGPSYGDTSLNRYVGQRVACDGMIVDYLLIVERIEAAP